MDARPAGNLKVSDLKSLQFQFAPRVAPILYMTMSLVIEPAVVRTQCGTPCVDQIISNGEKGLSRQWLSWVLQRLVAVGHMHRCATTPLLFRLPIQNPCKWSTSKEWI